MPAPLPAPVAHLVDRHRIEGAVDSAEIQRLKQSAAVADAKERTAVARAQADAESGNYRSAYAVDDTALRQLDREVALSDLLSPAVSLALRLATL